MSEKLKRLVEKNSEIFIQQIKEWTEILINFETRNKYRLFNRDNDELGFAAESNKGILGFLARQFLRTHRPLNIDCFDGQNNVMLNLSRPFFFFFSDLTVKTGEGEVLGHIHRRFGIIYKKYDLCDAEGKAFAFVKAPIWRLWTFPILDISEREIGVITKKWGGLLKEFFTDADRFGVQLPQEFTWQQKVIAFSAALSIDMDFFDDNHNN
jgi:hypothetical protein